MKRSIISKSLIALFFMIFIPHFLFASAGKPGRIKTDYGVNYQLVSDTTLPPQDKKNKKKKDEKTDNSNPEEVVKVIPIARRQPVPVPLKVIVLPVKIIKPNIIKPVVKPVIKILH
ncbi:MAG: hypothetical protein ABI091_11810 [Ferruginibacter sp.]